MAACPQQKGTGGEFKNALAQFPELFPGPLPRLGGTLAAQMLRAGAKRVPSPLSSASLQHEEFAPWVCF